MKTMWKCSSWKKKPEAIKVLSETKHTLTVEYGQYTVREKKQTQDHEYFASESDAWQFLLKRALGEVKRAEVGLERACERLADVRLAMAQAGVVAKAEPALFGEEAV